MQALQIKLMGGALSRRKVAHRISRHTSCTCGRAARAQIQNTQSSLDAARLRGTSGQTRPELWPGMVRAGGCVFDEDESGILPSTKGYERARELAQHALELVPTWQRPCPACESPSVRLGLGGRKV